MNCRGFQDNVFEYLEGGLSRRAQAAANRHLEQCPTCRQTVLDTQRTAQSLSTRFRQDTGSLVLCPNLQARIMAALEKKSAPPPAVPFVPGFWRLFGWLGAGAALILVSIVLVPELRLRHGWIAQSRGDDSGPAISLTISYCDPIYTFHTDGQFVVDSFNCQPRTVEESIRLSDGQIHHEQEKKSPL
jgi:hypothetical protein